MDWSSFTKGYFLNRDTLVGVLLLIDASIPPQKIDLDCANWLGRNNVRQLYSSAANTYLLLVNLVFDKVASFLC
jgi:GTP-binding protein EngB required for normal cell division